MKLWIRQIGIAGLLLTLLTPVQPLQAQSESGTVLVDRIVAVVNDGVILESELDAFVRTVVAQLRQQDTSLPPRDVLEKQALDRLIIQRLQKQMAERTGIQVDDESLNRAMRTIAERNGMSLDQFRRALEADGFSFVKFREDVREEIMITQLQQRQVANRVDVRDQEVENFLANQKNLGQQNKRYKLSHILIAVPDAASPERIQQARAKAESILQRIRSGADFAQTAVAVSDGQRALEGGDLGWFSGEELPRVFVDQVPALKPGQVSDLIRSPSGFHIVKLEDVEGDGKHMVEQTRVRHILIRPSQVLSEAEARRRLLQLRDRIEGGEDFADLARAHSQDALSAREGGSLGWVAPGDTAPRFEQAMQRLTAGEISEPVKTRFGLHLIQVLDRREQDDTEEFRRAKAREAIRSRKRQEALEMWLRQLRDEAYVEYRLNS